MSHVHPPVARRRSLPSRIQLTSTSFWIEIIRLVKYGLVGLSNTVVSLAVLNLFYLLLPPTTSLILVLGSTTAYAAGDLNSYWWNKSWTFKAGRASWRSFARFAVVSVGAMSLNALVVWASSGWLLGLYLPPWLLGNLSQLSAIIAGSAGYLLCRSWVFKSGPGPARKRPVPSLLPAPKSSACFPSRQPLPAPMVVRIDE